MGRPKGIPTLVAETLGVAPATVRRAVIAAGRDTQTITFEDARELTEQIADNDRRIGHHAAGRGEGTGDNDYAAAKAEAERHRAEKLRLQNEKLRGSLIDRHSVTQTGARIIAETRTALLSLGHRISTKVAGKSDTREIARIVETEVRDVLGALADEEKFFAALESEALE